MAFSFGNRQDHELEAYLSAVDTVSNCVTLALDLLHSLGTMKTRLGQCLLVPVSPYALILLRLADQQGGSGTPSLI
jgi:hypothetical protein